MVRVAAMIADGLLACLMGPGAWLVSIVLLMAGATVVSQTGLDLPAWTGLLAFSIGMPLGAWLETSFS